MTPRLYTENHLDEELVIILSKSQSHYLKNVIRKKVSDNVLIFNGEDGEWLGEIISLDKKGIMVALKKKTKTTRMEPDIWLLFAPVKNVKIDYLAQKTTELGVAVLQPVITAHTIVTRVNTERLRDNAIEAAEQCGRLTIPEIKEPIKFEEIMRKWPGDRKLIFCDESGKGKAIKEVLSDADKNAKWAIIIGPEGGFSEAERDSLCSLPYVVPVSLGSRILRADTAAIAALACWQEHLGDW